MVKEKTKVLNELKGDNVDFSCYEGVSNDYLKYIGAIRTFNRKTVSEKLIQ